MENQFSFEYSPEYRAYLFGESGRGSSAWLYNREMRLQHNRHVYGRPTCERCRRPIEKLDVHHHHYRNLGHEGVEDLAVVCRPCHDVIDVESKSTAEKRAFKVVEVLSKYHTPRCRTWSEWVAAYDPVVTGRGAPRSLGDLETDVEALFGNAN